MILTAGLLCTLVACDSETIETSAKPAVLYPLSPYSNEFTRDGKRYRIDYYFTPHQSLSHAELGQRLKEKYAAKSNPAKLYPFFSIYLYRQTGVLNATFKGDSGWLRGIHDDDLLAYARWHQGTLDIFYVIRSGEVVYDLLADQKIAEPWEFD